MTPATELITAPPDVQREDGADSTSFRPAVLLSMPLVWSVRNFVRSGIYQELAKQFRVIIAVPEAGKASLIREGFRPDQIWTFDRPGEFPLHGRWLELLREAHKRRAPTASDAIFENWKGARKGGVRARARRGVLRALGWVCHSDPIFRWVERQEERVARRLISPRINQLIESTQPVLGISTSVVVPWEWPLFRALQREGIPTATHILSFDNLTSRGYVPLRFFDRYMVWQETMAGELTRHYGVPPERIVITGTPQFDFHRDPNCAWTRSRTLEALGLDASESYFLHCANHDALTPNEPRLVRILVEETARDPRLRAHRWVVRLHPMDNYDRWQGLVEAHPRVKLSCPWSHDPSASYWAVPELKDLALLSNSLRHAAATLNVASTSALDSAVVDTPVVCVGFHPEAPERENRFYHDVHFSHHFLPILQSGAAPLVKDMSGLREALADAIGHRGRLKEARARLVADLCGRVDGLAARRVLEAITATSSIRGRATRQALRA